MVRFDYYRLMPKFFDSKASMTDVLLSNVLLLVVVALLFHFWDALVISIAVLSPIWSRVTSMWSMFMHPAHQRSLWNRYG